MSLPSFEALIAQANEVIKPYRWLVKQARCRACGNVHEHAPILMREERSGWWIQCNDMIDAMSEHAGAPVKFEEIELAWCEACNTKAAQELTRDLRMALDLYSNTTALAGKVSAALAKYDGAKLKEHFHHA